MPDGNRDVIEQRVREWNFTFNSEAERLEAAAVRRAAKFIRAHHSLFPAGVRASSATAAAVLAVKAYGLFLPGEPSGNPLETAQRVMQQARIFDQT
jgi:hypothetical protein